MTRPAANWRLHRRVLMQARPYWLHVAAILVLGLLAVPLALMVPLPLKIAVDSVIGNRPVPGWVDWLAPDALTRSDSALLVVVVALVALVAVLALIQELARSVLSAYTSERLALSFRSELFRHAQRLSLSFHDGRGTTHSVYRIQYDALSLQYVLVEGVVPMLTAALTFVGMVAVTGAIDAELALVALSISPILFGASYAYRRRVRPQWHAAKEYESSAMSVIQETLGALRVVKVFGREDHEQERFVRRSRSGVRARIRLAVVEGAYGLLIGLTIAAGTATVLYVGVRHVRSGVLTLGELLVVMSYVARLYDPLRSMSKKAAGLQSSLASAERAFALLDETPDVAERPNARPLGRARGHIALRGVSFSYDGRQDVVTDFSLAMAPGTRLGIAGTTGAGKTTLISLLLRLYDPTRGAVLLDGVDLRDYRVADLRRQFAVVLQEPVLFSASVLENIAYARPEASLREIEAAAAAAHADEFIRALPDGADTLVGERGMRLSGGERQRIGLARAFLKDAPILVLDEPTSSVDVRTEAAIVDGMERLMRGRTSIIIAHRLSTLDRCDLRVEVEKGRLATLAPGPAARGAAPVRVRGNGHKPSPARAHA